MKKLFSSIQKKYYISILIILLGVIYASIGHLIPRELNMGIYTAETGNFIRLEPNSYQKTDYHFFYDLREGESVTLITTEPKVIRVLIENEEGYETLINIWFTEYNEMQAGHYYITGYTDSSMSNTTIKDLEYLCSFNARTSESIKVSVQRDRDLDETFGFIKDESIISNRHTVNGLSFSLFGLLSFNIIYYINLRKKKTS